MGANFTPQEGSALYRLLAENTNDIIVKTDRAGLILHASPAMARLGLAPPPAGTDGASLPDLADPADAPLLAQEHRAVIAGAGSRRWIEFRTRPRDGAARWSEVHMRPLVDRLGRTYGALSVLRCIEERKNWEDRLFAAAMTDPLTGLTNRRAFLAMLQHLVDAGTGGCLALFDIDHFKAINLQFGPSIGDEVLVVFSEFVRTQLRWDDTISRVGNESLGVLLPGASLAEARGACQRIIDSLAEIHQASSVAEGLSITASAGLSAIGETLDGTIRQAEMALFFAKARGPGRLEVETGLPASLTGPPRRR